MPETSPHSVPPVFLAHGAPTLAVEDTPASRFLSQTFAARPKPAAILILSAHWETKGLKLSAPGPLKTVHDFRGFPAELYEIDYKAQADVATVDAAAKLLEADGYDVELDGNAGLDHGAWVPLSLAFPHADVPIVALSLPDGSTPSSVYKLGQTLAPLKERGVLIAGSGSTTHNLRALAPQGSAAPDWAKTFDAWLDKGLNDGQIDYFEPLADAPGFRQNHPTEEHLLPLFFAFGASGGGEPDLMHRSYEYGSISMSYYQFAA
ncbi:dioxygenase [Roseibium denhamense]|uniref:4,5-DOPA dioxygenase extradiol n=1 Tax=Roseibium denhamense TaxID=76305 RepID=A0ABY1PE99_9HYPH|nr:class III extradiol ring-cleavage dioxygenase [Roseibium denhamense]MTI04599.1 dioxygenase [Roseibium denhamense]SMP31118.1 4,5-DOPA dioxygenase extradiol [Roseibium denhamense]